MPWFTGCTLLALIAIYIAETAFSAAAGHPVRPSHSTLLKLGGVSGDLALRHGQVWRLLTAPLLHANYAHLIGNGVALIFVGLLLEPIVGWRWFGALYVLSGLGGGVGSMVMNPGRLLSVGASGAIMGVLAAALVLSFHVACYERRKRIWYLSLRVGIPALLPLGGVGGHIDYSAHMGGVIAGMIGGFALLVLWDEKHDHPPLQRAAGIAAGVVGAVSLLAFGLAAALPTSGAAETVTAGLMPIDDVPDTPAAQAARAQELVQRYPADPRAHAFAAVRWMKLGANKAAEAELVKGLDSPLLTAPEISASAAPALRSLLVALYLKDGDVDEAKAAAAPFCASPGTASRSIATLVHINRLCP